MIQKAIATVAALAFLAATPISSYAQFRNFTKPPAENIRTETEDWGYIPQENDNVQSALDFLDQNSQAMPGTNITTFSSFGSGDDAGMVYDGRYFPVNLTWELDALHPDYAIYAEGHFVTFAQYTNDLQEIRDSINDIIAESELTDTEPPNFAFLNETVYFDHTIENAGTQNYSYEYDLGPLNLADGQLIRIYMWGAGGGGIYDGGPGGYSEGVLEVEDTLPLETGEIAADTVLYIEVGTHGSYGTGTSPIPVFGFGGRPRYDGYSDDVPPWPFQGGGGRSAVRTGEEDPGTELIVAGGGGSSGAYVDNNGKTAYYGSTRASAQGGKGGGVTGQNGYGANYIQGKGGTQSAAGAQVDTGDNNVDLAGDAGGTHPTLRQRPQDIHTNYEVDFRGWGGAPYNNISIEQRTGGGGGGYFGGSAGARSVFPSTINNRFDGTWVSSFNQWGGAGGGGSGYIGGVLPAGVGAKSDAGGGEGGLTERSAVTRSRSTPRGSIQPYVPSHASAYWGTDYPGRGGFQANPKGHGRVVLVFDEPPPPPPP